MLSSQALQALEDLRRMKAAPRAPLEQRRATWEAEAAARDLPPNTSVEKLELGGVPCEAITAAAGSERGTILMLHGGGYVSGSLITHRDLAARLACAARSRVIVADYRLAPEHRFPAAPQDCMAVYEALLPQGPLALCGDSAGGGLVLAVLQQARLKGGAVPSCAALLSPWLDLSLSLPSVARNADADSHITRAGLLECAEQYAPGAAASDSLASPLGCSYEGFPPLYINVGDIEILLDDALIAVQKAAEAGVDVRLRVAAGLWHVYPAWAGSVPEAAEELEAMARFFSKHLLTVTKHWG